MNNKKMKKKMKKFKITSTFLLTILSFFSCDTEESKQLESEISKLKEIKTRQERLIHSLDKDVYFFRTKSDSLKKVVTENYLEKGYLKEFISKNWQYLTDKKRVFEIVYNSFNLDEKDVDTGLLGSVIRNQNYDNNISNQEEFVGYQLSFFDRSSKNIENFFTESTISLITSFFKNNSYYKDSGTQYFVEALLLAYENLPNDNQILNQLYTGFENEGYWFLDDEEELKNKIANKKVINYLKNNNYSTYEYAEEYGYEYFIPMVYSFWSRRHSENNKEIVYKILQKINNQLKK